MDAPFCDVIGCSAPAERFYSDGYGPPERLCSQHWTDLLRTARDRALRFECINPNRLKTEADEAETPQLPVLL